MKVWSLWLRLLHWSLAIGVAAAWMTSDNWARWHEPIGYAVLAIVSARVLWGSMGGRYARFRQFVYSPSHTARYAQQLLHGREPRYIGHNPLGGWMVLALLACVLGTAVTGWLFTTDRFWGDDTVQSLHLALAWLLLGLIALHLAGVIFTSFRHRENLVRAMLCGSKRAPVERDVS
ncbi:MAG: cytochrome b/b6 domain-containing protein [Cytophagales bacterium]|nr:cytochrome b/b6 domain-containing protein [Rhizobacter sp.]